MAIGAKKVVIESLTIETVKLRVKGVSPLIQSRFTEEAMDNILAKQTKSKSNAKEARDIVKQFEDSYYVDDERNYVHPAIGFKAAMKRAAKQLGYIMTDFQCWVHPEEEWIRIYGDPQPRKDRVRLASGVTSVAVRSEFPLWFGEITLSYNTSNLSLSQLITVVDAAGFGVGIGEWRPENGGRNGRFRVLNDKEDWDTLIAPFN